MKLTSSAFRNNDRLPARYTGEGADISPPLEWSNVPDGCKEFALTCDDPDAPQRPGKEHPFSHWVIYGIPHTVTSIPEAIVAQNRPPVPVRANQGRNSLGKIGYSGPMPPPGHGTHHYHFKLYALDADLRLPAGLSQTELLKAIHGHVLAEAKLTGTYLREAVAEMRP